MIIWRKTKPFVADVAQQALWIEFTNIRILGEESISLFKGIDVLVISAMKFIR